MLTTPNKPYFDDFNDLKGYLKVLFKPGYAVQTRELNQLQSIIQNQLGILANSIFKEGSPIKGGAINISSSINYTKMLDIYNNVITDYHKFDNHMTYGFTTGIIGRVVNGFNKDDFYPTTLYYNYMNSGKNQEKTYQENEIIRRDTTIYVSNITNKFQINEEIMGQDSNGDDVKAILLDIDNNQFTIVYTTLSDDEDPKPLNRIFADGSLITGTTSGATAQYTTGEDKIYDAQVDSIANTENPIGQGVMASVSAGIYYIDGYFTNVDAQSVIISKYENKVSKKVGFNKEVQYVTSADDPSLLDNANGSTNENAPGADRLKMNLKIAAYGLFEVTPSSFIEIVRLEDSVETFNNSLNSQWSSIMDVLAQRTFDESGSYVVNPFLLDIREFLDDGTNNGVYKPEYFSYKTPIEAQYASMKYFNADAPGTSHTYNNKYYPLSSHSAFLNACNERIAIGIEPGKGYILGYEVELRNKIYIPSLKARDVGMLNNSLTSIKYGNYCKVNNIKSLPNISICQTVKLASSDAFGESSVVGTAKVRMISYDSGTIGTNEAVYKLYIFDISMNAGSDFSIVRSLSTGSNGFSAKIVLENEKANLYDIDKNSLIFSLPANSVQRLEDISFFVEYTHNGQFLNDGSIKLSAPAGGYKFYSSDPADYILTDSTGKIINITDALKASGAVTSETLTLALSGNSGAFTLICKMQQSSNTVRTKTLVQNAELIVSSGTTEEIISLGKADGYKLVAVYDSEDLETVPTTSSKNITSNYVFDNGQNSNYYGLAKIRRLSNAEAPKGQLLIVFSYFNHTSGDYFSVNSYPQDLDREEIPTFTTNAITYDLKNCIDARPVISEDGTFESNHILALNSMFISDIYYYLPRIDLLELDYLGNFKVKNGVSDNNPLVPTTDINSLCLYEINLPSYTSDLNNISLVIRQNRRYTMYDIGILERRIEALENYIIYNQNDFNVENMSIVGADGKDKIKIGYLSDNFTDHSSGDILLPEYKCSINVNNNTLRPSFKLNTINLVKDTTVTSTVSEVNGKFMIPSVNTDMINQTIATGLIRLNSTGLVTWTGNLLISPSFNNNYNNIDQKKMNYTGDSEYLNEYNTALAEKSNTLDYNQVLLKWLGVN